MKFCVGISFDSVPAYLLSEHFEHCQAAAANTVKKARAKRAEASGAPLPEAWDIEDHLIALQARISPLKSIGVELLNASIRAYNVLWPESPSVKTIAELSVCLQQTESRLREWRSSSARAGDDAALLFLMS